MSNKPTTLIDEMGAAARGVVAILRGDRRAAQYFDFSLRGLVGSFIAFLIATAFSAYLPLLLGQGEDADLPVSRLLAMAAFLFAVQVGFAGLALRQLKRMDAFVPYLVADNWATFFFTVLSSLLTVFGLGGDAVVVIVGILVLVAEINISRLIATLGPWQIAIFLVAQLVGVAVGLIVMGLVFPLPSHLLAPS